MTAHSTLGRPPADSNPCTSSDRSGEDPLLAPGDAGHPSAADAAEDAQDAALLATSQIMQWSRAGLMGDPAPSGSTAQLLPDGRWQAGAACRDADAAEADTLTGARSQREAARVVQDYCERCPVRLACLADGRQLRGWGVFGGVVLVDGRKAALQRPGSDRGTLPARRLPSEAASSRGPTGRHTRARRASVSPERIRAWLAAELAGGPRPRQDVLAAAGQAGISPASVKNRVAPEMVVSTRIPGTAAVAWSLPAERPPDGPPPAPLEHVAFWLIDELARTGPIYPGAVVSDAAYPAEQIYEAAALLDLPADIWSVA